MLALALVLAQTSTASQSVTMRVTNGEEQVGMARFTQRVEPDGRKYSETSLSRSKGGISVTVTMQRWIDTKGRPLRAVQTITNSEGPKIQLVFSFDKADVLVVSQVSGERRTRHIPYPEGSIEAADSWWFSRDLPKPGTEVTYSELSLTSLKWEKIAIKFEAVGMKEGQPYYKVTRVGTNGPTESILDSNGMPIEIHSKTLKMVRVEENSASKK